MFDFRIIDTEDGNQIIRRDITTSYNDLTPLQMIEYIETDKKLLFMDRMKQRDNRKHCGIIKNICNAINKMNIFTVSFSR